MVSSLRIEARHSETPGPDWFASRYITNEAGLSPPSICSPTFPNIPQRIHLPMSSNDALPTGEAQPPLAPPSITITIPTRTAYRVASLTLHEDAHQVHVQLQEGTHTFTSEDLPLGVVHGSEDTALLGRLGFTYTFDAAQHIVIVCGTDYASAQGMHLVTLLEGTAHSCTARAAAAGFSEDDVSPSRGWSFHTPLTPGADVIFTRMARAASDALIAALKTVPGLFVLERASPPELSQEQFVALGLGWHPDELRARGAADGAARPPLKSSFGGNMTVPANGNFANVDGTTGDPYFPRYTSWIQPWSDIFNNGVRPTVCSSQNYQNFTCSTGAPNIIGGHVIPGQIFAPVGSIPYGTNGVVFIIPICKAHNNPANNGHYMAPVVRNQGFWLNNYHQ
jgi:hypothetical protein